MSKVPFSHLTPSPKPGASAVGESGYHLPLMPFLSGQDAVDSLIGYYPSKGRMDSGLNPHTYTRPSSVRSTTMPNTKVAELVKVAKSNWEQTLLATIDAQKSQLVAGFLTKCAEAGLGSSEILDRIVEACDVHPAIEMEFEKCGFEKQAYGSVNMSIPGYNAPIHSTSSAERWQQSRKPKYRPAPSRKFVENANDIQIQRNPYTVNKPGEYGGMETPTTQLRGPSDWYQLPTPSPDGPNMMDTLARQGTSFQQGWTPTPSGMPSRASMITGYRPPQQYTNGQGQMGLYVPSTEGNPGGWIPPEKVPQYQAVQQRRADWMKGREGVSEDHPYYSYWSAPGERTPGTIPERMGYGSFRTTPEQFMEDYNSWLGTMPEQNQAAFTQTAEQVGMRPEDMVRAMVAEEFLASQNPYARGDTLLQAENLWGSGRLKERPQPATYAERMRAYNQLPEDFQNALGQWQNYQVQNWRSKNPYGNGPDFSSPTAWIGSGDGNDWYFPAFPEHRHQMFNAEGVPQLLDPEKYMGLAEAASRYGIDFRNQDFRDYWKKAQGETIDTEGPQAGHFPSPFERLKSYYWDREGRQSAHDFDKSEDGAFAQRMFGFRRTDPRTGREIFTVDDNIGRHPGGLGGALKDTILGGLSAPATAGISLAEGDPRYAQMGGRSTLALFNHLLGADLGWNANVDANPAGFDKGQPGYGTDIRQDLNTTRGLFSGTYEPITGQVKPGDFEAVGQYYDERANNPDTSWGDRILSRGMATTMDKGDDVLYTLALMRATGMKPSLRNFQLMAAANQSLPNLIDPNAAPERQGWGRLTGAMGDAGRGYISPYTSNPIFPMAGQGFKEIPGTKHYFDTADRLRLLTSANKDAPQWLQQLGEGGAGTMEAAPEMLIAGQLGKNAPGGLDKITGFGPKQALGWSAFSGGMQGLEFDPAKLDPEARAERINFRLGLDREGQMRFDQAQKQMAQYMQGIAAGRTMPEGFLDNIDMDALMPEQKEALQELLKLTPEQQGMVLQGKGFQGPAIQAQSGQGMQLPAAEPSLGTSQRQLPGGLSNDEFTQQVVGMLQQMPEQQQAMWMGQLQRIEAAYMDQFNQMGAQVDQTKLKELVRQEAMRTVMQQIYETQQQQGGQMPFRIKQNFDQTAPPPIPQLDPNKALGILNQVPGAPSAQQPPPPKTQQPPLATEPAPAPTGEAPAGPVTTGAPTPAPTTGAPPTKTQVDRANMQSRQPVPGQGTPAPPPNGQQTPPPGTQQPPAGENPTTPPAKPGLQNGYWSLIPGYDSIKSLVSQQPEEAQRMAQQATDQATTTLAGSPEQKDATTKMLQSGQMPPEMEQKAIAAWTEKGYSVEQAMENFGNMDMGSKIALGAGLGLGVLGLINAISGEGGVESWLMGILGLGTAAYMGGNAGLFDQGAMDLTGGINQAAGSIVSGLFGPGESGAAKPNTLPPEFQTGIRGLLDSQFTDQQMAAGLKPFMGMMPADMQKQLDMAAGTGSWGNSVLSWLGDVSGQRQRLMKERLGLNPQQQDRLLSIWSQMRDKSSHQVREPRLAVPSRAVAGSLASRVVGS